MDEHIIYVGLDVHKETISVARFLDYLFALVPSRFTLTQLQDALWWANARTNGISGGCCLAPVELWETGEFERGSHRPAQLFSVRL